MVAQNEKLLKETYDNLINVALCVAPVQIVEGMISDQFMCYGTAADEEVYRFEGLKWMVERSKVELGDVKHGIKRYPKFRHIFSNGYSALIIEEVDVLIGEGADTISIRARLSTLCEYLNERWMIHHFHVSTPDANTQEGEAWPIEEWKRKNKELEALVAEKTADLVYKNRELEIEGSLGRIRAVAMSMNKTDDVLSICKVMFKELEVLGFKDVRNAVINFWDDDLQQLLDYDYSDFSGSNISHIAYDSHPAFEKFQQYIRSATDSFVELVISGDELKTWKERRRRSGEYEDPRLEGKAALHYYFYSIDVGAIGISTFSSFTKESLEVLKRFRNVFDLAYRRYIDIQQAEAQAREAKIELSLERIRAQVTSMQASSELLDIVVMMRKEFVNLGHEAHYFWYMRWLPDIYQKAMTSGDGTRIGMVMTLPRHMHGNVKLLSDWEKSNEPVIVYAMDADAAVDYIGKMISLGDFEIVDPNAPTLDDIRHIGGLTFVMARTTHGEIGYSLPGSVFNPSQEALATLVRFAAVFDLAYKRFLDLQLKEEQSEKLKNEKERLELTLAELKVTQRQLIQSEKMASLGELTAGIAHEIQNPLNFVNNFSDVNTELLDELQQELTTGNKEEAMLLAKDIKENELKINHHGKRAEAIVKGMLQHSGANSGKKEPTDINALANEYFRLSYHGLRAKDKSFTAVLATNFDPSVGEIEVFGQDIGRVLLNLFNNAFYSVNEKKKTLDDSYKPEVRVTTEKHDGQVYIKIKDNGTGIPEKLLSKIYQPFFTTKPTGEGTGLGLSLSYDIITKGHGGEMKVETKEGEGSEFKIQLPAS